MGTTLAQDASEGEKMKDCVAFSQIHQIVGMSTFQKITSTDHMTKQVWDILKKTYNGIDKAQENNLMMLKSK